MTSAVPQCFGRCFDMAEEAQPLLINAQAGDVDALVREYKHKLRARVGGLALVYGIIAVTLCSSLFHFIILFITVCRPCARRRGSEVLGCVVLPVLTRSPLLSLPVDSFDRGFYARFFFLWSYYFSSRWLRSRLLNDLALGVPPASPRSSFFRTPCGFPFVSSIF